MGVNRPRLLQHPGILGHWREYREGSIERAKALGLEVLFTFQRVETTKSLWQAEKELVEREQPWIILGLPSLDAFIEAVTGHSESEADAKISKSDQIRARRQEHPHETQQQTADAVGCDQAHVSRVMTKNSNLEKRVITPDYKSDTSKARFRKLTPAKQEQVRSKQLSLNQAALEEGVIKTKTPLEHLRHWWAKASLGDRQAFLRFLRAESTESTESTEVSVV
jgi:hypothetical protein